ncbi:MAG TPA: MarR family transcriptional regulator [Candidatus Thermoplasmatota archaeon]
MAILVALSPIAAADEIDEQIALDVDGDEVVVRMVETLTAEDAQEMRADIDDDFGNGDGTVTMDEVSRFNAEGTLKFDEDEPQCFDTFELALIDEQTPKRLSLMSGRAEGATGPVSSTSPLKVTAAFTFLYATAPGASHLVQVEFDEMDSFGEAIGCYMGAAFGENDWSGWTGAGPPWARSSSPAAGLVWPFNGPAENDRADFQQTSDAGGDDPQVFLILPRVGHKIDQGSIQPAKVSALWDGTGIRADTRGEQLVLMDSLVTFTVQSGSAGLSGTVKDVGAAVGFTFMGGGFLLLIAGFATEYGRFNLWKLLFLIPGFSRLEKDEVLEHNKRDELYRFIKQNPGPSFSDLRRELSLSNGTLVHHLRILEGQEYVKAVRDGFRTRFYVRGPKIVMESYLTRTQIQLVEAISANPGLTQKELSQLLGLPRESVSYHTKQLAAKGRLAIKQEGKWRRYWLTLNAPGSLKPVPVQS